MDAIDEYDRQRKRDEKRNEELLLQVMKTLHPLVSPYDLSEANMMANYHNNPYFNRCVKEITHQLFKAGQP